MYFPVRSAYGEDYFIEYDLRIGFYEHGSGVVYQVPRLHDLPVVAYHLLLLELQYIPALGDLLELADVVDPPISEFVVDCVSAELHERQRRTPVKCSYLNSTCSVSLRDSMNTVLTMRKASRSSYAGRSPAITCWKKVCAMLGFSKARSTQLIFVYWRVPLWKYT